MTTTPAPRTPVSLPPMPAGTVQLPTGTMVKFRDPFVVAILTVVTLGIYTIFWWYQINREMADYGLSRRTGDLGTDPAASTLALFPGAVLVVPAIWTTVTTFQRIQAAQRLTGRVPLNGWLGLVLALVLSPALHGYMQSGLNAAWAAASTGPVEPR
jgi:Domain of unknown function (DUF4234)